MGQGMETAWEKETNSQSVVMKPVWAGGWHGPSFHPVPTAWAQDLLAPAGGVCGGDHHAPGSWRPSSPPSRHSGLNGSPLLWLPTAPSNNHKLPCPQGPGQGPRSERRQAGDNREWWRLWAMGPHRPPTLGSCHSIPTGACQAGMWVQGCQSFPLFKQVRILDYFKS